MNATVRRSTETTTLKPAARYAILVPLSAALAALLERIGLPAGLLLGPMIAAIAMAGSGRGIALPKPLSRAGQSIVGVLIATSFTPALLTTVVDAPLLFAGTTFATLMASVVIGIVLTRLELFDGTISVWGSMPGAATAMTLMARDFGADERIVAVMTFTRVAAVAAVASVIAALLGGANGGHGGPGDGWFPHLALVPFGTTIAVAVVGASGGLLLGLPAGALLGPLIAGGLLSVLGLLDAELPGWLLTISYALVGWTIGLGFNRDVLRAVAGAFPRILIAVGSLILFGAALGLVLRAITGRDLLTCYLATSPGGADSVAIIASGTKVDTPFVMAMQVLRFLTVLVAGPWIAERVARRMGGDRDEPSSDCN